MAEKLPRRKRGSGSIHRARGGRFVACPPSSRTTTDRLGIFGTYEEAEAALDEWARENPNYRPLPTGGNTTGGSSGNKAARAVADYLEDLRLHHLREPGQAGRRSVTLGRLEGFPLHTSDPEVVERAAQLWTERASVEGSILKELDLRNRAMVLREAAQKLRDAPDLVAAFVTHAADYGKAKGIQWATWRDMGVPASVLREAGISP